MQKRGVIIGVAALVLLLGMYAALREPPKAQLTSAYTLEKVEGLARIEITPPAANSGAPALISLERREDGWWMVQPVEAPLKEDLRRDLDGAFGRTIKADDLKISQERAADYLLDDPQAARVKLFTRGAPAPHAELQIGKQMTVESTRALRTFVKPVGDPNIYRLQAGISFLREPDPSNWRSEHVLKIAPDTITRVTIAAPGQPAAALKRAADRWTMEQPEPGLRLEEATLNDLSSALEIVTATAFFDGKQPAEVGLTAEATTTLTIEHAGQTTTLSLAPRAATEPGKEGTWALQIKGAPSPYEVSKATGDRLTPSLESLRSLTIKPLERDKLKRVVYASGVTLEKIGESWQLVAPQKKAALDATMVDSALTFITNIRVMRRDTQTTAQQAGLTPDAKPDVVRIESTDGVTELLLGRIVDTKEQHRWAKLSDSPDVFIIDKYNIKRLSPPVEEWTTTAPPSKEEFDPEP